MRRGSADCCAKKATSATSAVVRAHFSGLLPLYLAYFRRDFHPTQHDDSALLAKGRAELEALLARNEGPLRQAS